jgi:hypothetical protein
MESYSASSNSWTAKDSMPTGRSSLGVGVSNGKLYAVGGSISGNITNANEAYTP